MDSQHEMVSTFATMAEECRNKLHGYKDSSQAAALSDHERELRHIAREVARFTERMQELGVFDPTASTAAGFQEQQAKANQFASAIQSVKIPWQLAQDRFVDERKHMKNQLHRTALQSLKAGQERQSNVQLGGILDNRSLNQNQTEKMFEELLRISAELHDALAIWMNNLKASYINILEPNLLNELTCYAYGTQAKLTETLNEVKSRYNYFRLGKRT